MTAALAQHSGTILLATAALAIALVGTLIWINRHLEMRLQHVEHEMATMLDSKGLLAPTTPEVTRRYEAMGGA